MLLEMGKHPVPQVFSLRAREEPGCLSLALPNLGCLGVPQNQALAGPPCYSTEGAPGDRILTGLPSWAEAEEIK